VLFVNVFLSHSHLYFVLTKLTTRWRSGAPPLDGVRCHCQLMLLIQVFFHLSLDLIYNN